MSKHRALYVKFSSHVNVYMMYMCYCVTYAFVEYFVFLSSFQNIFLLGFIIIIITVVVFYIKSNVPN